MAKARKRRTAGETTAGSSESDANVATAVAEVLPQEPGRLEAAPFEPTGTYTPTPEEQRATQPANRGRFRSWVSDPSRGYSRLSDEEQRRIVLMFDEKPPADVLTAVKDAGFQYQSDYHGLKSAWTRYNDHEGRIQAEGIDNLVRSLIAGASSPER